MEKKTHIHAEEGKQELLISREFDLPVDQLFLAHADPEIFEQWMGTKVLRFESKKYGAWQFETRDPIGDVVFRATGVFHEFEPNRKITRTFEMENTPFEPQLEYLEFDSLTAQTSKLRMHIVYRSLALRDQMLQLPFAQGLNMAHNRLQKIVGLLK